MNILYASNDGYACFLGISLYSLLVNNKKCESITVYILSNGISQYNIDRIQQMISSFNRNGVVIDIADLESKFGFEIDACGYNITTFARLFIDDLLPQEVEKILYLDSDIIVNRSISDLWNEDIEDVYAAAVVEVYMPQSRKRLIGLSKEENYYNAGMLLINRSMWRNTNLKNDFISYYKQMNGTLLYNDQDIINHCCKGKVKSVSAIYNFEPNVYYFPYYYLRRLNSNYFTGTTQEFKKMIDNPVMIHFLGDERPWVRGNKNPYREIFFKYQRESEWMDIAWINGNERYMCLYHILNLLTKVMPPIRTILTNIIGINKFKWFGKQ